MMLDASDFACATPDKRFSILVEQVSTNPFWILIFNF
jgi:hypothetical protein